ncbi:hypothetical protein [Azospirillum soli]|uniref:hypothetical protein n=1 Tax=Azospirillum soli TaxID=1304799 RepID=UPI001AE1E502|nr:hypothetical protein [Azospirillum soli]MBP2316954.1 hypothetical protein [Azospirillum soli]
MSVLIVSSVAKFDGGRRELEGQRFQAAMPNRLAMKVAWAGMSLVEMQATYPGSIRNFVLGGADFSFRRSSPLRTGRRR